MSTSQLLGETIREPDGAAPRERCRATGSRPQRDPRRFNLVKHPIGQKKICFVLAAVGVTHDRCDLKAARKIERGRWVIEDRIDVMTHADVERELDPRVDLRFIELREKAAIAPLRGEVLAPVLILSISSLLESDTSR